LFEIAEKSKDGLWRKEPAGDSSIFLKQIQTLGIHKLLVIMRASDCVLPLIHIYASK